ncbi:LOW QUALITY PROTEIN: hypothetical protein HZS_2220 [Henneguya salminicola]|nr:LOW QUALITY PROTEIN: hypothetical protein HZS_2220 [Henneguya salminicola]
MDVMCKIGYKNKEAYFSIKCAKALGNMIKKKCPAFFNATEFRRFVCRKYLTTHTIICIENYLVNILCVRYIKVLKYRVHYIFWVLIEKSSVCKLRTFSTIPKKNNRNGLTSKAPIYTNCGFDNKYPKFCFNTKCTNSSKLLKNCNSYHCKNINGKFRYQIDPDSEISRYLNNGTFIFYSEKEKDQSLQYSSYTALSSFISVLIILLLLILILLRKTYKKNWLNLSTQNN